MQPATRPVSITLLFSAIAVVFATTGCALLNGDAQQQRQAQAALARWTDATQLAGDQGVAIVGELTGQVGDWESAVGDNNKPALMAGLLEAQTPLPTDVPPNGTVIWQDGTSRSVSLISASDALAALVADASEPCQKCEPIMVTDASLGTVAVETTGGSATVPAWLFALADTSVQVSRVAVANKVSVVPPAWDPSSPPAGISIDAATVSPDESQLTVSFEGEPLTGDQTCGADYTAEAVESDLAVVVIIYEHRNLMPALCAGFGGERTAVVALASPLGNRAVLEVRQGLQVPVSTE